MSNMVGKPQASANADAIGGGPVRPPRLIILDRSDETSRRYWCERFGAEGYDCIAPDLGHADDPEAVIALACQGSDGASGERPGLFATEDAWPVALAVARSGNVGALVGFASAADVDFPGMAPLPCPAALHVTPVDGHNAASLVGVADRLGIQLFDAAAPVGFASPLSPAFDRHAASVALSRTLSVLRPALGPRVDLGRLFREHLAQEFVHQDADATMGTMIGEPYVNHIPTLTGGYGHDMLKRFYKYHFIPSAARSRDRQTTLVSEIIGADSVVLEMVISFIHDEEHEYMLPGVKPTGRTLKIPSVVVAKFQGDKLCHEHIYWDQASLLAQIGALDPTGLPIAGAEQAEKVLDPSLPSNLMMPAWARSEGKPI